MAQAAEKTPWGVRDTIKAYHKDDGFVDLSTFLTNRRGSESIAKTTMRKLSDAAGKPMEWIDQFTSDTIVRARYAQNLKNGMDGQAAIDEADAFTAGLMADRSKGSMPTMFNTTNPVNKLFTMFQLEVNNQLSYMSKDVTRRLGEQGVVAIGAALTKIFVSAFAYNLLYRELTGRDAAFDPIGALVKAFGIGQDDEEERTAGEVLSSLGQSIGEQTPFIGGLVFGGGRIPISSAVPNLGRLGDALTNRERAPEKNREIIGKELMKPATFLLPPFGGGAVKKIVQGRKMVAEGGMYQLDDEGKKQLLFPQYGQETLDYARAIR